MNKYILDKELFTFNASSRTITFTRDVSLSEILLITNVTDGTTIYNFACEGQTGTVLGNVLTLNYDTSEMSNTDELLIILVRADNSEALALEIELNTDDAKQTLRFMAVQLKDIKDLLKLILS